MSAHRASQDSGAPRRVPKWMADTSESSDSDSDVEEIPRMGNPSDGGKRVKVKAYAAVRTSAPYGVNPGQFTHVQAPPMPDLDADALYRQFLHDKDNMNKGEATSVMHGCFIKSGRNSSVVNSTNGKASTFSLKNEIYSEEVTRVLNQGDESSLAHRYADRYESGRYTKVDNKVLLRGQTQDSIAPAYPQGSYQGTSTAEDNQAPAQPTSSQAQTAENGTGERTERKGRNAWRHWSK